MSTRIGHLDIFARSFIRSGLIGFMDIAFWYAGSMVYDIFHNNSRSRAGSSILEFQDSGVQHPTSAMHLTSNAIIYLRKLAFQSPQLRKPTFQVLVLDLFNPAICCNSTAIPNFQHLPAVIHVQAKPFRSPNNENRYLLHPEDHHDI